MAEAVTSILLTIKAWAAAIRTVEGIATLPFLQADTRKGPGDYQHMVEKLRAIKHANIYRNRFIGYQTDVIQKAKAFREFGLGPNVLDPTTSKKYRAVPGEIPIEAVYYFQNTQDLDVFQLGYFGKTNLPTITEFSQTYPELGAFKFGVEWGPLSDKVVSTEENVYKSVSFTATIGGVFFTFLEEYVRIEEINATIRNLDYTDHIYSTIQIVP